jgi:hypothetical protein
MARSIDVVNISSQAKGFDMVNRAREAHAKPSLAEGRGPSGLPSALSASGSPGAALGTGSNSDRYTPGIELV